MQFGCTVQIVKRVLGTFAEIYRRGGDEIVAFAPGMDAGSAQSLGERIRAEVEAEFRTWGRDRDLSAFPTASIGVVLTAAGRSFAEVVALMDEAQHEAKQRGKIG
jgi:GGDEF domain-containing protein